MTARRGRSVYHCEQCRHILAFMRPIALVRVLTIAPNVPTRYWEHGTIELTCPACQHKRKIVWRPIGGDVT